MALHIVWKYFLTPDLFTHIMIRDYDVPIGRNKCMKKVNVFG